MATEDAPRQISVSRDALRADLAELELRLRSYFDTQIGQKANAVTVEQHARRVDMHDNGVFPPAWEMKVNTMIDSRVDSKVRDIWGLRSAKAGIAHLFVALSGVGLSLSALITRLH